MAKTAKGFQLIENGELAFLQSPLLEQSGMVDHAFSTRRGGCSTGAVQSLNTAFHTGDTRERVLENRRRLIQPWGYEPAAVVAGIQAHGTDIALDYCTGSRTRRCRHFLTRCDALVTATGVVLTAYSADCLLLFWSRRANGDRPGSCRLARTGAAWRKV